jgi:hypothetical protein
MEMLSHVRDELIGHLQTLSDLAYQRRVWVNKDFPPAVEYDEPDLTIHFLYDETGIADEAENLLGVVFKNQNEISAMKKLIEKLNLVLEKFDIGFISPAEFINAPVPEWKSVIDAAKAALIVFGEDITSDDKGKPH